MDNYICGRCKLDCKQKSNYDRHINRKKKCELKEEIEEETIEETIEESVTEEQIQVGETSEGKILELEKKIKEQDSFIKELIESSNESYRDYNFELGRNQTLEAKISELERKNTILEKKIKVEIKKTFISHERFNKE